MRNKKSIRALYRQIEEDMNREIVELDAYKEIRSRRDEASEIIENSLGEEDRHLIDQYVECENDMACLEMEEYFVKGFSMACQLLYDALR